MSAGKILRHFCEAVFTVALIFVIFQPVWLGGSSDAYLELRLIHGNYQYQFQVLRFQSGGQLAVRRDNWSKVGSARSEFATVALNPEEIENIVALGNGISDMYDPPTQCRTAHISVRINTGSAESIHKSACIRKGDRSPASLAKGSSKEFKPLLNQLWKGLENSFD